MKKKILLLAVINILWGLIPIATQDFFAKYSLFSVVFVRFLISGLFLLILAILGGKTAGISIQEYKTYLFSENSKFFQLPQWVYLLLIGGIGMNANIILFFWGLKEVGAIITAMGFIIALIILTFLNWGLRKEEFSGFKTMYLVILIITLIILAAVSSVPIEEGGISGTSSNPSNNFNGLFEGLTYGGISLVVLYGLSLVLFIITSDTDQLSTNEFPILKKRSSYEMFRSFMKLAMIFIFSALSLLVILSILYYSMGIPNIPTDTLEVNTAIDEILLQIDQFFGDLERGVWWKIPLSWNGLTLIFFTTIIPYIIYYRLAESWKEGTFDLWAGVLQIVEPIINIIVGVTFLNENFPVEWLLVIIILLCIAIFIKYISETQAQIQAIILIKLNPLNGENPLDTNEIIKRLYRIKSIRQIHSIMGEFDLMCTVSSPTKKYLNLIVQKQLNTIPRISNYQILIITDNVKQ